jgi:Pvc16 N-terminal domain
MELANDDGGQVLRSVSEALRNLIRQHIPELQAESAVVFDSPGEIDSQDETRLSLYLYQTEINPYLRNLAASLTRRPGADRGPTTLAVTPAPLVMDLLYLMVPYARSAELELVLVDKLGQLFHDIPELSGEWLNPVLKRSGNQNIAIVPDTSSIDTLRNIWAGFPNKSYKLTKLYTLSPVQIPSALKLQTQMVTSTDPVYVELP